MVTEDQLEHEDEEGEEMHFLDHLSELRLRLGIIVASISVFAIAAFVYSVELFDVISAPFFAAFADDILIGTGPAEAFILRLKLSALCGTIISIPVIFHQAWLFIAPGLLDHEKKYAMPFVFTTSALFLTGVWFCYKLVLPFAFDFFKDQYLALGHVTPTIKISEYMSLLIKALLGFGVVFETPVLAFLLGRLGLISSALLISGFRYAVVTIFILSAILTPPDILTQFLMAGPLILLYSLSILIVRYTGKNS